MIKPVKKLILIRGLPGNECETIFKIFLKMSRTTKKPLTGSKADDPTCRNGTCPTCITNRKYKIKKLTPEWKTIKNYETGNEV